MSLGHWNRRLGLSFPWGADELRDCGDVLACFYLLTSLEWEYLLISPSDQSYRYTNRIGSLGGARLDTWHVGCS
jgi:hypothetical protein